MEPKLVLAVSAISSALGVVGVLLPAAPSAS
jgi:hypothetical protein